jgi:hypothetical protein
VAPWPGEGHVQKEKPLAVGGGSFEGLVLVLAKDSKSRARGGVCQGCHNKETHTGHKKECHPC